MDDNEARLRVRLERLAAAVPVRASQEVVVERVRPSATLSVARARPCWSPRSSAGVVAVGVGLASRLAAPATWAARGRSCRLASDGVSIASALTDQCRGESRRLHDRCGALPANRRGPLPLRGRPRGPGRDAVGVGPPRSRVGRAALSVGVRAVHPAASRPGSGTTSSSMGARSRLGRRRVRHLVRGDPDHDFGAGHHNIHPWPVHRGRGR